MKKNNRFFKKTFQVTLLSFAVIMLGTVAPIFTEQKSPSHDTNYSATSDNPIIPKTPGPNAE